MSTIITFRKVCNQQCGYDRAKTWEVDDPYTPNELTTAIKQFMGKRFTTHIHKSTITVHLKATNEKP